MDVIKIRRTKIRSFNTIKKKIKKYTRKTPKFRLYKNKFVKFVKK